MKLADISNWCHSLSERAVAKLFKNKAKRTSSVTGTSSVAGASDLLAEKYASNRRANSTIQLKQKYKPKYT